MRLRLDKLVLSAGLALALVATTIPAIAGTTTTSTTESGLTLVSDGSTVDLDDTETKATFVSDVIGVTAGTDTSVSGISKVTAIGTISGFNKTTADAASSQFTSKIVDGDKMILVTGTGAGLKVMGSTITITETYNFNAYSFETAGVTGTSTEQADAGAAEDTAKDAAREKVLTEVKTALDLKNDSTSNPTVDLSNDSVAVTEAGTLTATSAANATDSNKFDGTCTVAAGTKFNVNGSVTVTKVYTVETLPSKYTIDLVFSDAAYSTSRDYKLVKDEILTGGNHEVTYVEGTKVNNGKDLLYSTTDLDSTTNYYLVYNLVSTSDALLFAPTSGSDAASASVTVGSDTATITNAAAPTGDELTAFTTALTDNNLTKVAYFKIEGLPSAISTAAEFKIAEPTDLPAVASGYTREYKVLRYHDLSVQVLDATVDSDGYIVFSSDKFSNFALAYVDVAADTTEEETNNETETTTEAGTGTTTTTAGSSTTSTTASEKTGDNSMMPLFMTTLLLALCAGSLAIYKEKKTN